MSEQCNPVQNNYPAVWDMVIQDMLTRDTEGIEKYGTRLQPFNGRDSLRDAYEEVLDLTVYLRQHREELRVVANDMAAFLSADESGLYRIVEFIKTYGDNQ